MTLEQSIKRALVLQCIVSVVVLLAIVAFDTVFAGYIGENIPGRLGALAVKLKASMYGSVLAIIGTLLSARSVRRSIRQSDDVANEMGFATLVPIYSGLLNKLVIVAGGIAVGLVFLGLEPAYVVIGYFVVQIATVFAYMPRKLGDR